MSACWEKGQRKKSGREKTSPIYFLSNISKHLYARHDIIRQARKVIYLEKFGNSNLTGFW
jgi:hypothetical protein